MKLLLTVMTFFLASLNLFCQEICDNGLDDDNNGFIDLQDTACFCLKTSNISSIKSIIPNYSFEDTLRCPDDHSQMNCVKDWQQVSGFGTSDYYNTCGYQIIPTSVTGYFFSYSPPPMPIADGNGYVGFGSSTPAKEYIATCLPDTLYAGVNYKLFFEVAHAFGEESGRFSIFGTNNNCLSIPYSGFDCPTTVLGWVCLDSTEIKLDVNEWNRVEMSFTPTFDITSIAIGPSCKVVDFGQYRTSYYYLDNVVLNKASYFKQNNSFYLKMPNTFSPNKDGINDLFHPIQSNCLKDYTFYIYNRWGQIVYENNSLPISWDGTNKGNNCSAGVYFWMIKFKNNEQNLKGNISLFR